MTSGDILFRRSGGRIGGHRGLHTLTDGIGRGGFAREPAIPSAPIGPHRRPKNGLRGATGCLGEGLDFTDELFHGLLIGEFSPTPQGEF